MTDTEALFTYRLRQAEETLADARKMVTEGLSPSAIINRAYYALFYLILALFLKNGVRIKSSKHSGVISAFDKEFVRTGKLDPECSKILHELFDARLDADYKEFVTLTAADAKEIVAQAESFFLKVKVLL